MSKKKTDFLRIANEAKAIKAQLVKLETKWNNAKKRPLRFNCSITEEEITDAIFALEMLARDAFMLVKPEAQK